MITKDVFTKATAEWASHLKPITELSKNETTGESLVVSSFSMYNFDSITKELYNCKNYPTSTDALFISTSTLEFIEFKSGFKQRLTKESFNEEKGKCSIINEKLNERYVCVDYWELFLKNQKHERQILIDSIRSKGVESYITLEKKILGTCNSFDVKKDLKVKLTIVIDENGIDSMESILGDLSKKETSKNNCFSQIRNALLRVNIQKDCAGGDYFYDEITVISATDFLNRIKS